MSQQDLTRGSVRSCGCLKSEVTSARYKKIAEKNIEKNVVEGTNVKLIAKKKLNVNNTSGIKGVTWDKSRNLWAARITFKGKHYNLGRRVDKKEAKEIRQKAEENIFGEFLEWYENEYKKDKKNE